MPTYSLTVQRNTRAQRTQYDGAKEAREAFFDAMESEFHSLDMPDAGLVGGEIKLRLEKLETGGAVAVLEGEVKRVLHSQGAKASVWECGEGYRAPVDWKPGEV